MVLLLWLFERRITMKGSRFLFSAFFGSLLAGTLSFLLAFCMISCSSSSGDANEKQKQKQEEEFPGYVYIENDVPTIVPGHTALGGKLTYVGRGKLNGAYSIGCYVDNVDGQTFLASECPR
jgi:hypothetical protein